MRVLSIELNRPARTLVLHLSDARLHGKSMPDHGAVEKHAENEGPIGISLAALRDMLDIGRASVSTLLEARGEFSYILDCCSSVASGRGKRRPIHVLEHEVLGDLILSAIEDAASREDYRAREIACPEVQAMRALPMGPGVDMSPVSFC